MKKTHFAFLKSPSVILLIITSAGIALRLFKIDDAELWHDEACTVRFARMALSDLMASLTGSEPHPPVYYLFMKIWIGIFGESEISLRLPSLIAGSALIPAVYLTASRLFDRTSSLLSAMFVAFSPISVYYSVEARNYMLVCFVSLLAFDCAITYLKNFSAWRLALFSLLFLLSLFTHFYTLFLTPAYLSLTLLIDSPRKKRLNLVVSAVPALVLFSIWQALFFSSQASGLDFLADYWKEQGFFDSIYLTLKSFFAGVSYPDYLGYLAIYKPPHVIEIIALSFLALILFSAFIHTVEERVVISLFVYFSAPVLTPCLISLIYPIYLSGRYEMVAFPGFAILAGTGIRNLTGFIKYAGRSVMAVFATIFLSLCAVTLTHYMVAKGDFIAREVASRISEKSEKGGIVIFTDLHRPVFEYEFRRIGAEFVFYSYPLSLETQPCWMNVRELLADRKMLDENASSLVETAKKLPDNDSGVYIVLGFDDANRRIANIAVNFTLLDRFAKSGFEILDSLNLKGRGYIKFRLLEK